MSCQNCFKQFHHDENIPEDDSNYISGNSCLVDKSAFIISTKIPNRCWGCSIKKSNNTIQGIPTSTSLYMEDKSATVVYKHPLPLFFNVNWNQSSDRPNPHKQITNVQRNTSSLIGTRTSLKPGACSPGGIGVDIKHNSFYRYNLRIRGSVLKKNKCCK